MPVDGVKQHGRSDKMSVAPYAWVFDHAGSPRRSR
jgi:hypothetical protein